jgi:hypothetical protein
MSMSVILEETYISVLLTLDFSLLLITKASIIGIDQQSNKRATPLMKVWLLKENNDNYKMQWNSRFSNLYRRKHSTYLSCLIGYKSSFDTYISRDNLYIYSL